MKKMTERESKSKGGYSSLYFNPMNTKGRSEDEEDGDSDKENSNSNVCKPRPRPKPKPKPMNGSNSLQLCMQMTESDAESFNIWEWDYSESEAAPASSWSTFPNRSLIWRPLPLDIGTCTCFILKEPALALFGGTLFSLYTNEGEGRQNRKLAVALHRRRKGRSHFTVAQHVRGLVSHFDDSFLGTVTANLFGSKYYIWDQAFPPNSSAKHPKPPLAVVTYIPTVTTCTGTHRTMRAYIPKHQSISLKNTAQVQHVKGLPMNWEAKLDKVHQLFSRAPLYNKISKQYELHFRDKAKAGLRIQRSIKNFQLTLEENGRQTILQLGRVGKSKFIMDYRYPLTGYQAFCMCLASIDAKICCAV